MSGTVRLEDDDDVSRGDMICRPQNAPKPGQDIDAMVCWMTNEPLVSPAEERRQAHHADGPGPDQGHQYRLDVNTLHRTRTPRSCGLNEFGRVQPATTVPLLCDPEQDRSTGSFIPIDEATGVTSAGGMINSGS